MEENDGDFTDSFFRNIYKRTVRNMLRKMAISIRALPESDTIELLDSVAQELRQGYEELAISAERELSGRHFIFSRHGKELYPYFEESDAAVVPGCILPIKEGRLVASVDSSCVLIGETSDGALYAARAAVGISYEGMVRRFVRLGPVLVYVSRNGVAGIRAEVTSLELDALISDHSVAERAIRNKIERRVIESLLSSSEEVVVMADGSLKHPFGQFSGSLPSPRVRNNGLIGFSKSSNLIFSEGAVGSLSRARGAVYHILDQGPVSTLLAKFCTDGLVFRLDLLNTREEVPDVLGKLLWNDAFPAGYPESLKLAHHLSVFTKADGEAIRALVTRRFRLRRVPTITLRRIALGGFNGGA